ncbi:hypothetical protein D3C78_1944080 [compost metagenome]
MDEHFQLHARHLLADLFDLFERQLAGQDHPAQAQLLPELHTGPVDRIGLY